MGDRLFVPASQLYDIDSRTPIAHPAHQATDEQVRRALEGREVRADGGHAKSDTEREYCEYCGVELGPNSLCTSRCPNDPHHDPGLIGTHRGNKYSKYAAVYQKAVVDVRNRNEDVPEAVSGASDAYGVNLSKEATADLEWVVEVEAEKFEQDTDHELSFLHDYFDDQTVRTLSADTPQTDGGRDE